MNNYIKLYRRRTEGWTFSSNAGRDWTILTFQTCCFNTFYQGFSFWGLQCGHDVHWGAFLHVFSEITWPWPAFVSPSLCCMFLIFSSDRTGLKTESEQKTAKHCSVVTFWGEFNDCSGAFDLPGFLECNQTSWIFFLPPSTKEKKKTKTNTHYHIHKYGDTLRHVNESCLFCMITEETAAYSARLRSNMFLFIALSSLQ